MSTTPIKPCPFCGGTGKAVAMPLVEGQRMAFMHVECQACGASGPTAAGVDAERAIGFWDDRKPEVVARSSDLAAPRAPTCMCGTVMYRDGDLWQCGAEECRNYEPVGKQK